MTKISYSHVYQLYAQIDQAEKEKKKSRFVRAIDMYKSNQALKTTGLDRLELCRKALASLDTQEWERSFHQRLFHDHFIRACAKIFWKTEPKGEFARCHEKILQTNGWDNIRQEVLVSTPRRFGKTISVSMFAAAMLYLSLIHI